MTITIILAIFAVAAALLILHDRQHRAQVIARARELEAINREVVAKHDELIALAEAERAALERIQAKLAATA